MQPFPLLKQEKSNVFLSNPLACGLFFCLSVFGTVMGRALFTLVYEQAFAGLLATLAQMARPKAGRLLLYALPTSLAYCATIYVCGFSPILVPIWALVILLDGMAWGLRLGAGSVLMASGYVAAAWFVILIPMLLLLPMGAYLAVSSFARAIQTKTAPSTADRLSMLAQAAVASAVYIACATLLTTLGCLYCFRVLFN